VFQKLFYQRKSIALMAINGCEALLGRLAPTTRIRGFELATSMNWKNRWLERARRDHRMPPSAFRLAHGIAATANRGGVVSLHVDQIAARCAISRPTIRLALDRLAALR
jgi:hypothetical protein